MSMAMCDYSDTDSYVYAAAATPSSCDVPRSMSYTAGCEPGVPPCAHEPPGQPRPRRKSVPPNGCKGGCGSPSPTCTTVFCWNTADVLHEMGRKLLKAAQCGQTRCVKNLLMNGADPSYPGPGGWTPLHRAAADAHSCVLEVLLNRGAFPNARNCCGLTALHLAAGSDFTGRCVSLLLEAGADMGSRTKYGRTPLHYAALAGNESGVRLLVSAGASEIAEDDKGRTPCSVAKTVCVRRLLRSTNRRKRSVNFFTPPNCAPCDC